MADLVPLGELGEIVSGSTPSTGIAKYWDGDIPWITPADLTEHQGVYFAGKLRKITKAGFDSCSTKMLPKGSILFSSRAPIGHCAVAAFPLCTNQGFKSIIPDKRLNPIFGYFALKYFTPDLVALGRGATFAEINKEIFESFCIPLPPLPEQRRIAAILEKADHLRRTRRYAQQLSDTFLQSVFLEMFGDPVTNPKGWDIEPLENKIYFLTSGSRGWAQYYATNGDLFIRIQNVGRGALILEDLAYVQPPDTAEGRRTQVQAGDMLLSITADLGRTAVIPPGFPKAYINQHLALIRLRGINPVFVSAFINSAGGRQLIMTADRGGVKAGLNFDDVRNLKVIVPPLPLQEKFAKIARRVGRLRGQQREATRLAEHLFQTLLHQAFQGDD